MVDLPGRGWCSAAHLLAEGWSPPPSFDGPVPGQASGDNGDFAVLALTADHPRLPPDCGPLQLAPCGPPDGQQVSVIGYPRGAPAGLIATGQLTGRGGPCPEWVQLEGLRTTGAVVERGFSGAAVWDPARRRIIGLVTAAHTDRAIKIAWMLPIEAAARFWPPLASVIRAPGARPCTPPSPEAQYVLADALLEVPQIEYDSGRSLRTALPQTVRRNIRDHAFPRHQLQAMVAACMDHRDGCPALRAAVLELGGNTASARYAVAKLDRLCCATGEESGADA